MATGAMARRQKQSVRTMLLYVLAVAGRFRWTLAVFAGVLVLGGGLYLFTPQPELNGARPDPLLAVHAAWMALLAQPEFGPPQPWYLNVLTGLYPLVGFVLIGEGVVRLALLISSREHGSADWMRVMASTYRDHVVLCGLGHLGYRVLEQLRDSQVPLVILEKNPECRFLEKAKSSGVPILIRDMTDDAALIEAGIERARVIIVATNDDMANLEVALDARRLNAKIKILMRLYDQQLAGKLSDALTIDEAFSASALAAPVVAAMALGAKIRASFPIGDTPTVAAEVTLESGSRLAGLTVQGVERSFNCRVLARVLKSGGIQSPPAPDAILHAGDAVAIHCATEKLNVFVAEAKLK